MSKEAETPAERRNRNYLAFKEKNPGVSYADWASLHALKLLAAGGAHATIGPNLHSHANWWEAGAAKFGDCRKHYPLQPYSKVVDYGCGSLRVGAHFIRYLNPKSYFGLEVAAEYIEIGKGLIGAELIDQKRPILAAISEETVAHAVEFNANMVVSTAVSYHVHPDEASVYFGNLARIAHRPGAVLLFDASLSDEPVTELALSRPINYFIDSLPHLQFIRFHGGRPSAEVERQIGRCGVLEFRRL